MYQTLSTLYQQVFSKSSVNPFDVVENLVDGLRRMETNAIAYIMAKTEPSVRYLVRQAQLPETHCRDILHDALVILIKKIQDEVYDSKESAPATYLIAIARNLVANQSRRSKAALIEPLEQFPELVDHHILAFQEGKERRELLDNLLQTLGDPCAQLIRLKYLDGYRDEEILAQKLTHYTTPLALRSKRSKCFQKLIELAAATKNKTATIIPIGRPQEHSNHTQ